FEAFFDPTILEPLLDESTRLRRVIRDAFAPNERPRQAEHGRRLVLFDAPAQPFHGMGRVRMWAVAVEIHFGHQVAAMRQVIGAFGEVRYGAVPVGLVRPVAPEEPEGPAVVAEIAVLLHF